MVATMATVGEQLPDMSFAGDAGPCGYRIRMPVTMLSFELQDYRAAAIFL
jgi:hypothetical protein